MDKSISINKSKTIKVLAIFMMVFHHLFGLIDKTKVSYKSLMVIQGIPIEELTGRAMDICVPIFLFLSGYGLYKKYRGNFSFKNAFIRIKKLYQVYLIIFIIFIGTGHLLGIYKFNLKEMILNLLTISSSYNREWWFLNLYILLIILYPLTSKVIKKLSFKKCLALIFILDFLGLVILKLEFKYEISDMILNLINTFLVRQVMFNLGNLVAKYGIFDKWIKKLKLKKTTSFIILLIVSILLIFRVDLPVIDQYIYIGLEFIFIFMLVILVKENSNLIALSKHTTNIWLTHTFFCYYLFKEIAFFPKYSVLIFIWNIILSLMSSTVVNYISKIIIENKKFP